MSDENTASAVNGNTRIVDPSGMREVFQWQGKWFWCIDGNLETVSLAFDTEAEARADMAKAAA